MNNLNPAPINNNNDIIKQAWKQAKEEYKQHLKSEKVRQRGGVTTCVYYGDLQQNFLNNLTNNLN